MLSPKPEGSTTAFVLHHTYLTTLLFHEALICISPWSWSTAKPKFSILFTVKTRNSVAQGSENKQLRLTHM